MLFGNRSPSNRFLDSVKTNIGKREWLNLPIELLPGKQGDPGALDFSTDP